MKDGKNTIIVLPQFQIDGMVEVMDYILSHPMATVGKIKDKFDLNEEEYQMIYDFCMPHERIRSNERYWIIKYKGVLSALEMQIGFAESKKRKTVKLDKLKEIVKKNSIGNKNELNKETFDSCDLDDEMTEEEEIESPFILDEKELNKHGLYLQKKESA